MDATATPAFAGSVDHVGLNRIFGWVKFADMDVDRAWVSVTVDGATIRSAASDIYRDDLFTGGIGDGCYGFDFAFAAGEVVPGNTVAVHAQRGQTGEPVL